MSYREHDVDPTNPEICDVPSRAEIHLLNGLVTEIVIPCSYVTPAVDEDSEETYDPIHLTAEGYTDPVVAFADPPDGLSAVAWIDEVDDSVIHCVFTVHCPNAVSADLECEVSVLITRDTGDHGVRTDSVLRGLIEIEAAPIP